MNTIQISRLMNQDEFIRKRFKGVYPIDLIPKDLVYPSIIVVNQDKSYQNGSHWVVLHHNDVKRADHFDSLGKKPIEYLNNLLISKNITYKYNNKRIQNYMTETCGHFCLYYSFYSCRGWRLEEILETLSHDLQKNEEIVTNFVLNNFNVGNKAGYNSILPFFH